MQQHAVDCSLKGVVFPALSVIGIKNEILEFQVIYLEGHNAIIHMEGMHYGEQG
ncbi:hypothetical protein [Vibrio ponticus]|uniref:hypothetical protein n=1 Tax=Vibrio ponticus TaxID=265668 RepID=UPI0013866D60|nr:hypothetical protein [Vibrio ponticus]